MYYKESGEILQKIMKAKKILVACHKDPDADALASLLAIGIALKKMGKNPGLLCSSEIPEYLGFLSHLDEIEITDIAEKNFSNIDLLIILDTPGKHLLSLKSDTPIFPEDLDVIVIDHHVTNEGYGLTNLVDGKASSTTQVLYSIFADGNIKIDKDIAFFLLAGIIGDTGGFIYPGASSAVFKIAAELIDFGADKDKIIKELFFTIDVSTFKFWSHVFKNMKIDKNYNLVWSIIPFETVKKFGGAKAIPADKGVRFFQKVKGVDIGILFVEKDKKSVEISFRSKADSDVSKIASELGGGGHKNAAGAILELPLDKTVEKVLKIVKRYVKNNRS